MDPVLIIGLLGAAGTTFAFLPQSIKALKSRHTKDLSLSMIILMELGIICWLIYGIQIGDIPIIAANSISIVFMTLTLMLKLKYK
jgi:MtN3 and saliva related transmembrane protein